MAEESEFYRGGLRVKAYPPPLRAAVTSDVRARVKRARRSIPDNETNEGAAVNAGFAPLRIGKRNLGGNQRWHSAGSRSSAWFRGHGKCPSSRNSRRPAGDRPGFIIRSGDRSSDRPVIDVDGSRHGDESAAESARLVFAARSDLKPSSARLDSPPLPCGAPTAPLPPRGPLLIPPASNLASRRLFLLRVASFASFASFARLYAGDLGAAVPVSLGA
ncbi:hypothetical protein KM043_018005 [Ampulex compressa]|nr:hypothetical protein KM043_018005 [Ampulex compressa]